MQTALQKILATAPANRRTHLEELGRQLRVDVERRGPLKVPSALFQQLREAVSAGGTLAIEYTDVAGKTTGRLLSPTRLVFQQGAWYIQGSDSLSGGERTFRVDRISACNIATTPAIQTDSKPPEDAIQVVVGMPDANARWYMEHPLFRNWQPQWQDGRLTLQVPQSGIPSLLATIIGFAGQEVLMEPAWLIEKLVKLAESTIAAHRRESLT